MKFSRGLYSYGFSFKWSNTFSGSSTLTLEAHDRVGKHQRSRGRLQLQAPIQTMLEATRFFLMKHSKFDAGGKLLSYVCVHLHHRCILSGGNPHLHRSTVQIWFALPQVQPLTVEINTHVTSASVCLVSFVRDNFIDVVLVVNNNNINLYRLSQVENPLTWVSVIFTYVKW